MAKKREDIDIVKPSPAEVFARQRRLRLMDREEGEALIEALVKAGFKVKTRGDASLTMATVDFNRFVIDLTK